MSDCLSGVFFITSEDSHSLYINKSDRLYQFVKLWKDGAVLEAGEKMNLNKKTDVDSLLRRFHTRELYEIPSGQGFCLPYGFIDDEAGEAKRNIAVTYRMVDHPDVMILFQDASFQFPGLVPHNDDYSKVKDYDAKDYAKWLWNNIYMLYPNQERKLLWPRWFTVTMDDRKGSGSFMEVTKKNGEKDYGYLAFVRGNPDNGTKEPDLQVFVSSVSDIAEGHPRMSPDELKALAEHIVSSVRRR
ncbi:T6SS immunity protein Tli4 family protein [Huaxiibacter chinensis]|uniref:T6SS immunity protein Tli4 family protein n=1 Tax=Huaxiibacter chinensis TaxID=2899785 RepID=UPI003D31E756